MKQFQIAYKNDEFLRKELEEIKQWCNVNPSYTVLFRIYSDDMNLDHIKHVCDILDEDMPEAMYLGCTTHANLLDGVLNKSGIIMSCTVFEYETTQVKMLQFPFSEDSAKEIVCELKEYCEANPWVNSIEMHATMLGMSVRDFCEEMSTLRDDIQIFGGGSFNPVMDDPFNVVFSKGSGFSEHGIIFLLLGGSDFHTYSTYIAGWKPLTKHLKVTKAEGAILYELENVPAFDIYQKYLNISPDRDTIIANTLEFPLFMDYKGVDVLRCPLGLNEDGSLIMATETPMGSSVRIAYGDADMILSSIRHDGQKIADFQPDVIQTFSCATRRAFWGDDNVSDETMLFNSVAPISGFYTSGEFLRTDGALRNFNITIVLAAMREGEPKNGEIVNIYDTKFDNIESEKIPLIRRFVSFIEVVTNELEETNRKLEEVNRKLALASITDGLTGLYNRTEIERGIRSSLSLKGDGPLSLIMLDLDDFKLVNDTYGHQEGDSVIIALTDVIRNTLSDIDSAYAGRWGGEEFMVLLHDKDLNEAAALAEKIRVEFTSVSYEKAGRQTVSLGVVQVKNGENADAICSRVDKALYMAKANGKNQVVKLD